VTLENIQLFKVQALRAFAHLYKSFPVSTTVEHLTLLKQSKNEDGSITVEVESGVEGETILWLYNQGFIAGNLVASNPLEGSRTAGVANAQLTSSALRILQATEPNANGVTLGEFVAASAFGPSEDVAADLLLRRLLGT
jgi:hypothetical protein